ncbi:GNAT family N-acetyltransferase [Streptomyces sp. NPDC048523]|uniref:GNAT family N-acetyltransferase n=1 Tax=Streptomyces sp. NPDC048523 TaxID=3365567 RepID=UPI00371BA1D6
MVPSPRWNSLAASSAITPTEIVLRDRNDRLIGQLRFHACPACRTGRILDIWVCDAWQHQGLGRELVHCLLAHRPGYRWSTTLQTQAGRAFFLAMAQETTVAWPHAEPLCCHLTGSFRRIWRALLDRRPPPC